LCTTHPCYNPGLTVAYVTGHARSPDMSPYQNLEMFPKI